jgi:hypothetical protein
MLFLTKSVMLITKMTFLFIALYFLCETNKLTDRTLRNFK